MSSRAPSTKLQRFKDEYVSTEHILLAIASGGRDPAAELLARTRGNPRSDSAGAHHRARQPSRHHRRIRKRTFRALEQYGRDLTELAAAANSIP